MSRRIDRIREFLEGLHEREGEVGWNRFFDSQQALADKGAALPKLYIAVCGALAALNAVPDETDLEQTLAADDATLLVTAYDEAHGIVTALLDVRDKIEWRLRGYTEEP